MKVRGVLFVIAFALVLALMLALLELNKNLIAGTILTVILSAGFCALRFTVLSKSRWYFTLSGWIGWIVLFVLIFLMTWPPVKAVPAVSVKDPEKTDVISLDQGDLQGVLQRKDDLPRLRLRGRVLILRQRRKRQEGACGEEGKSFQKHILTN